MEHVLVLPEVVFSLFSLFFWPGVDDLVLILKSLEACSAAIVAFWISSVPFTERYEMDIVSCLLIDLDGFA